MWSLPVVLALAAIAPPAYADPVTFSVGDPDQYNLQATPTADGNVITYSGDADAGIDVFLSASLREKVIDAAKNDCQTFSNKCFQSINDVLKMESILDSRDLKSRQVGIAVAGAVGVLSIIISGIRLNDYDLHGFHFASPKLDLDLATASQVAVVTEDGKPAVTITQDLSKPTGTGPDVPSMTVYTSAADGHEKGDVVITLPDDLAKRADEIIARLLACDTAEAAPARRNNMEMRAPDVVHDAICGARAIYTNEANVAQLDIIQMPNINLLDPALMAALNQFIVWARARGEQVRLPAPQVDSLAVVGFILALIRASGNTIQRINVLRANYVNADIPTTVMPSATATPTATTTSTCGGSCTVSCSMLGVIEFCKTGCPSCTPQPTLFTTVTIENWAWPTELPDLEPMNECTGDMSDLPWDVFEGIPGKFCTEVGKDTTKALEWTVNSVGDQAPKLGARGAGDALALAWMRGVRERSPPLDPGVYSNYRITLKWEPHDGEQDDCLTDCPATYAQLAGGECNPTGSFGQTMKVEASIDNMCGVYSYHIEAHPRKTPMSLLDQQCHDKPQQLGFVSESDQDKWGRYVCDTIPSPMLMKSGDPPISWTPDRWRDDALLTYTISWVDGCQTEVDLQNIQVPVEGKSCIQLLREDYTECHDNAGAGGWRQAGCLKYEFTGHDP